MKKLKCIYLNCRILILYFNTKTREIKSINTVKEIVHHSFFFSNNFKQLKDNHSENLTPN